MDEASQAAYEATDGIAELVEMACSHLWKGRPGCAWAALSLIAVRAHIAANELGESLGFPGETGGRRGS